MSARQRILLWLTSGCVAIGAHAAAAEQQTPVSWEVNASGFSWIVYGGLTGLLISTVVLVVIWFKEWQQNKLW